MSRALASLLVCALAVLGSPGAAFAWVESYPTRAASYGSWGDGPTLQDGQGIRIGTVEIPITRASMLTRSITSWPSSPTTLNWWAGADTYNIAAPSAEGAWSAYVVIWSKSYRGHQTAANDKRTAYFAQAHNLSNQDIVTSAAFPFLDPGGSADPFMVANAYQFNASNDGGGNYSTRSYGVGSQITATTREQLAALSTESGPIWDMQAAVVVVMHRVNGAVEYVARVQELQGGVLADSRLLSGTTNGTSGSIQMIPSGVRVRGADDTTHFLSGPGEFDLSEIAGSVFVWSADPEECEALYYALPLASSGIQQVGDWGIADADGALSTVNAPAAPEPSETPTGLPDPVEWSAPATSSVDATATMPGFLDDVPLVSSVFDWVFEQLGRFSDGVSALFRPFSLFTDLLGGA